MESGPKFTGVQEVEIREWVMQLSQTWLDSLDESNMSRQCHTKDCDANVDHRSFGQWSPNRVRWLLGRMCELMWVFLIEERTI